MKKKKHSGGGSHSAYADLTPTFAGQGWKIQTAAVRPRFLKAAGNMMRTYGPIRRRNGTAVTTLGKHSNGNTGEAEGGRFGETAEPGETAGQKQRNPLKTPFSGHGHFIPALKPAPVGWRGRYNWADDYATADTFESKPRQQLAQWRRLSMAAMTLKAKPLS